MKKVLGCLMVLLLLVGCTPASDRDANSDPVNTDPLHPNGHHPDEHYSG